MDTPAPKKPRGRPFTRGNNANPAGARSHSKALQQVRRLTKGEIAEVGGMLLYYTQAEIKALATNPNTPMLQSMLAGMILQAHKNPTAFEKLLDRVAGKVKENISFTGEVSVKNRHAQLTQEELEVKRRKQAELLAFMGPAPTPARPEAIDVTPAPAEAKG